jgi:GNAT superfamily N-acetyltransferase
MKSGLVFRKATVEDTNTIVQFGADTFKAAFGPYNTSEDMAEYLAANFNHETIQSIIEDVSSFFLLGHEGNKMIGYAMLKEGTHPDFVTGPNPIELVRFYVTPEVIGLGYGSELMQACLDKALAMGHKTVWLATWQKNERAIRFYEKWGFRIVGNAIYIIGDDVTDDFVMQWSE